MVEVYRSIHVNASIHAPYKPNKAISAYQTSRRVNQRSLK